jgi:AraC-like DNA-binding protein
MERYFEQQFNQTPREWATQLRCRLAVQLLSQGWSTKAVAEELKFADESHFCHAFKKALGRPPQSFTPTYRPRSCFPENGAAQAKFPPPPEAHPQQAET